jgi:hypothetical protein
MSALVDGWNAVREARSSGDLAIALGVWALLRATTRFADLDLTEPTIVAAAVALGLLSASLDLIPDSDE